MEQNHSNISHEELQKYTDALFNQVAQLKAEIERLHSENDKLKALGIGKPSAGMSDEEWVAINEIRKLRDLSLTTELTLDDSRRLDTYVKILTTLRKPKEEEEKKYSGASIDTLLSAIDNEFKLVK